MVSRRLIKLLRSKDARNFVRGLMDGLLTVLGIMIGASATGSSTIVLLTTLSGGLAGAFGNMAGALVAEEIDVSACFELLENKMSAKKGWLTNTRLFRKSKKEAYRKSMIDGVATLAGICIAIWPFVVLPFETAFLTSLALSLSVLFFVGYFLQSVSKKKAFFMGVKVAMLGMLTALVAESVKVILHA